MVRTRVSNPSTFLGETRSPRVRASIVRSPTVACRSEDWTCSNSQGFHLGVN